MTFLSLLVTGLLVGNELAIAAFVHPAFYRVRVEVHTAIAQALARRLGSVMPFWYAASCLLAVVQWWISKSPLALVGAILLAATIIYTILLPVPINNRIAKWNLDKLPPDWFVDRKRWDTLHRIRVVVLMAALGLLLAAATR